ncbi:MAG: glycosyltransferase [Bacteroidetes bacterium]|nr:MAG: glycosyltransferase [Bacteroidota bacterium]
MIHPLLSIITINYNDVVGIDKTIQSVNSQSYNNIEYIIIDGLSDDGSVELIKKHAAKISYWISEKDTGIFNAMNKGIKASKGDYLLFLNSGDILNGTSALGDFINHKNFKGDIIYGDYKFEDGEKIYPDDLSPLFFIRTSLPHQSTFFKRTVFDKMGDYNEGYTIVSDRAFFIKCFLSNLFTFQHIKYSLTIFDLSGMSNDADFKQNKKEEDERMFEKLYGIYYIDYKNHLLLQRQLYEAKRNTIKGIWKRIKKRLSL